MWCQVLSSLIFPALIIAGVAASTDVYQWTLRTTEKPFPFSVTTLDQKRVVSLPQCGVECSKLLKCVGFDYKRYASFCTMYQVFTAEDDSAAIVQRFSDTTYGNVYDTVYRGCYIDDIERVLPYEFIEGGMMTVELCRLHCIQKYYSFFGLEMGRECRCGNMIKSGYARVANDQCNRPCAADPANTCGGKWRMAIYELIHF